MPIYVIHSGDDPRLSPYRALKDRELAERDGLFIAEGEHLVRRLIASDFAVHSILLADRRSAEMSPLAKPDTPVFVAPQELLNRIVGFKFHSGVLAAGVRKPSPALADVLRVEAKTIRIAACPEITNAENLGSLIRLAAGFGADAMLLGPRSIDPFMRQAVRVSMGTIFRLPIVQSQDFLRDLATLRNRFRLRAIASMLDASATSLAHSPRGDRTAILFGNEAQGLDADSIAACDERVTIPMRLGTDSLNVANAAAIFMWHYWA